MVCAEFGRPGRIFVESEQQIRDLIRKYNHKTNCYRTVYNFEEAFTGSYRSRPNYDTAIVDKVFMDFDGDNAFENMLETHNVLERRNLKHYVNFSGNGFHIYIMTDGQTLINKKAALKRYSKGLSDKQDPTPIGDLARIARIAGTYHLTAHNYCIPLTHEDLHGDFYNISMKSSLAPQITLKRDIIGEDLLNLSEFDYPYSDEEVLKDVEFVDVDPELMGNLYMPQCVFEAFQSDYPNFHQRQLYFIYMKECGVSMNSALAAVKDIWTKNNHEKIKHCYYVERQPQTLYDNDIKFPSKVKVIEYGLCRNCKRCEEW